MSRGTQATLVALAAAAMIAAVVIWLVGLYDDPVTAKSELIIGTLAEDAPGLDDALRLQLAAALLENERATGVDALLVLAVIERESTYDPAARGPFGGLGLMQVKPGTAAAVADENALPYDGRDHLFDALANVRLGTHYLAEMKEQWGDWERALTAYNMGPTRLRQLLNAGKRPSQRYARAVVKRWEELQSQLDGEISP